MTANKKTLDVGCGPYKEPGSIGVDQFPVEGVDIVCDLNQPWPFENNFFDRVIFRHSINHLNNLEAALTQAARVTKKNGVIEIIAPHFSSDNIFTDPTIKFFTGFRTMNYYCKNTSSLYSYYSNLNLLLESSHIYLFKSKIITKKEKLLSMLVFPLEFLINKFPRVYEKFFCFIIRANEVKYILRAE